MNNTQVGPYLRQSTSQHTYHFGFGFGASQALVASELVGLAPVVGLLSLIVDVGEQTGGISSTIAQDRIQWAYHQANQ
jgi:hypothetical protein